MDKDSPVPAPMEALLAAELPEGDGWQYEPKWDGFRCLARRDGDEVDADLQVGQAARAAIFPKWSRCCARARRSSSSCSTAN